MNFKLLVSLAVSLIFLSACESYSGGDSGLTQHTTVELMDWHIAGFWFINCPVAWIRVFNKNPVPIKDIVIQYDTYDEEDKLLSTGTYTLFNTGTYTGEGNVPPMEMMNFIEQHLGFVGLRSERLTIKLLSVSPG